MIYIKKILWFLILTIVFASCAKTDTNQDDTQLIHGFKPIEKTNKTKLYMHYMPWFHSMEFSNFWGIHWQMSTKNPENILPDGKREIASYYYPMIGPYDNGDPDVVDYHLLLMKYAGIDGVLIDWYGIHDVLDYGPNFKNSNALIEGLKRTGIEYAIVYEDFTVEEVQKRTELTAYEAAKMDMRYMEEHYFSSEFYITMDEKPLLMTFGPSYFKNKLQWKEIFGDLTDSISFLPLWHHRYRVGEENSVGEFSWVDFTSDLEELEQFYTDPENEYIIGSAYPGFHDFYFDGGWGESYGYLDHFDGATLANTLAKAETHNVPIIQLVTWNDFGEGTMIEPTDEFQFSYLEMIQDFAGVNYDKDILETILDYYEKRKAFKTDPGIQLQLDTVFTALADQEVLMATDILSNIK
jgi:glycoprotein endo-alpha-1,2-mannosidase